MERIETLRILAEARNAFNKVLENHGIEHTTWDANNPTEYYLYTQKPGYPMKNIAKITYSITIIDGKGEK